MSALGACGATPLPAPNAPADATQAAAEKGGAASGDVTEAAQESGSVEPSAVSFQQMMSQAQAGPAGAEAGAAPVAAAAAALSAVASDLAQRLESLTAAATCVVAADPLPQSLSLCGQEAGANTAAASATTANISRSSDSDADALPEDDSLLLAALAQLGITLQPVVSAPATDVGAAPVVAADAVSVQLPGMPKTAANTIDGLATRLRPGMSFSAAVNADVLGGVVQAGSLLQSVLPGGNALVRDLLDGNGGDASSRIRDPAETAAAARAADASGLPAAVSGDAPRTLEAATRTISAPVQHPRWAEAVSSEIRWFAEQGVQSATLRLTPEHLGPVEVRLSLSDSQVTVNFAAASAETRAALEQSLPRLREMLAGAGLSLGEAQVQQQMRQGSQNALNRGGPTADTDVRDSLARVPIRLGLVDEYA